MSFSYRIHIKLPDNKGFKFDEFPYCMDGVRDFHSITIRSPQGDKELSEVSEYIFYSDGFDNYDEAEKEGEKVLNSLIFSFVKLKKGIDFGAVKSLTHITQEGLQYFQDYLNEERLLEGGLGLKVYKTLPSPKFITSAASVKVLTPVNKLEEVFNKSIKKHTEFSKKEFLSIQLFNSSFFEKIPESRFLLLVMAVEVLITYERRTKEVSEHIGNLLELTKSNKNINIHDKRSIVGSLSRLKSQSIGQAGKALAENNLGDNEYYKMPASKFFTHCYGIRSNLVHGNTIVPSRQELGILSLELEKFVSDLLTKDLGE